MRPLCGEIVGNDWSTLVPEPGEMWTPHALVSICIPVHNPGPGLARTLKCLAAQTYPHELIEVVIGHDGSDIDFETPEGLPFPVTIAHRERTLDFGAGRARNTAAEAASGEILFFLDGDVIPERHVVASYARWFDRCELVVPTAICRFVDVDHLSDEELVELVMTGDVAETFAGADVDDQGWRERHFERTLDLRIERIDAFRMAIGATIAVSADQFRDVGGFPELGVRGVEDTAFGYRLHNDGAVVILDRDATHWHQGRRNLSDPEVRDRINEIRAPYVESVIPVKGSRLPDPPARAPVPIVPVARIRIGDDRPDSAARRSIAELDSANLALTDAPLGAAADEAFVQVDLPADVAWSPESVERIWEMFAEHPVGVIRALVGGGDGLLVTISRTRAIRRAAKTTPGSTDVTTAAEAIFGVWWADAGALGLIGPTVPEVAHGNSSAEDEGGTLVERLRTWPLRRFRHYRRQLVRRHGHISSRMYDAVVSVLRAATR